MHKLVTVWRGSVLPGGESVEESRLVGRNHVLDVNERVVAAAAFERLQCLVNQISEVLTQPLRVLDSVAQIHCTHNTQCCPR